jgi:hypothetical protein
MMTVAEIGVDLLARLFAGSDLGVVLVGAGETIPGSYWGESEAGLIRHRLFVRLDTPLHSALHEAAHYLCMDSARREILDRDAGGDYAEEDAVCYLQVLLIDRIAAHFPTRAVSTGSVCSPTWMPGVTRSGSARRSAGLKPMRRMPGCGWSGTACWCRRVVLRSGWRSELHAASRLARIISR